MKSALSGIFTFFILLFAIPALAQMPPPRGISAVPTHRDISYAPAMPATRQTAIELMMSTMLASKTVPPVHSEHAV